MVRGDTLLTPLDRSLVDAWPLLPSAQRRGPVIQAVNDRLTTPQRLEALVATLPRLPGRAKLSDLLGLLAAGCLSPLEIYGHRHVFSAPGMPPFQRQVRVRVGGRTCYLDVFAERERVDFELDGTTVHGDPRQRERDLSRDALLATLGIQVVRFSHHRLVYQTEAVRREILAILARRAPARGRSSSLHHVRARRAVLVNGTRSRSGVGWVGG